MNWMPAHCPPAGTSRLTLPPWQVCRVLESEILDEIPARDAEANIRDMARINRLFGGFRLLRKGVRDVTRSTEAVTILDVAAAGAITAEWLERAMPRSRVTSVDLRPDLLSLGKGDRVAADAIALPFPDDSFDVVVSTLFLHHLSDDALALAVAEMLRVARHGVVAVDLARHPLAYRFLAWSHPLFRWNWITRVDGPRSVQAAFTQAELQSLLAQAGHPQASVRMHHPWFRLSMVLSK